MTNPPSSPIWNPRIPRINDNNLLLLYSSMISMNLRERHQYLISDSILNKWGWPDSTQPSSNLSDANTPLWWTKFRVHKIDLWGKLPSMLIPRLPALIQKTWHSPTMYSTVELSAKTFNCLWLDWTKKNIFVNEQMITTIYLLYKLSLPITAFQMFFLLGNLNYCK